VNNIIGIHGKYLSSSRSPSWLMLVYNQNCFKTTIR
jgi:hypothetical protein